MRNTVLLSVAAGVAEKRRATKVWYGPNADDREGYADCRDEYAEAMERALTLGTDRVEFEMRRPVVSMEKDEIVARGDELGVPFEHTWSCYQNEDAPCGVCASCEERARGFEHAGVDDPVR
jgi:7-cyano-7-deazaguanine synthase